MTKPFFEVFPALKLSNVVKPFMDYAGISRIAMNRDRTRMQIFLESERLIEKRYIVEIEKAVKNQLFGDVPLEVKIIEKFLLSGQYTAANLLPVYEDSILYELKSYNIFLYSMLRGAKKEFEGDDTLHLVLDENTVSVQKEEELIRILEKILCERCGLPFKVSVRHEKRPSASSLKREMELENEIEMISRRSGSYHPDQETGQTPAADEIPETIEKDPFITDPVPVQVQPAARDTQKNKTQKKTLSARKNSGEIREKRGPETRRGGFDQVRHDPDDPDQIFGKYLEGEITALENLDNTGEIFVHGQILKIEDRDIQKGLKKLLIFDITDFTDTVGVKVFLSPEQCDDLKKVLKKDIFVLVRGVTNIDKFDGQLTIGQVSCIRRIPDFRVPRMDTWPEKRVELHCHTKMSDMDGVSDVRDILKRAMDWGHSALAITDHGAVQAFPDANHTVPSDSDFKVIYGVEGYLVDDLKKIAVNTQGQSLDAPCVVFDLETTGFSARDNRIIEIGAVKISDGKIQDRFSTFVNPKVPIPFRIEELTSISDDMVMGAPAIEEILPDFMKFCEGCVMAAHNASFDMSFIMENCRRVGIPCEKTVVDTVAMARVLLPQLSRYKLDTVAKAVNVSLEHHHRAVDDAACTAEIYLRFLGMLRDRGIEDLDGLNELGISSEEQIRKLPTFHIILLAKNDIGRINLYRLVSWSHTKYFARRPRIPKSLLEKYREGLIIGSACEAGELYRALVRGASDRELAGLVSFYDYLEIQPIGNNLFMTEEDYEDRKTVEELKEYNRMIVKLGEQYHKPVAATCDVHFLDPQDEIYRRIIMAGKNFKDGDRQPPLYLRTTEEMLKEFEYLGEQKAREVVITNTVKIAAMCDRISPVRPDKCPPVIPDSDQILRSLCYEKAHELYGDPLPKIVEERLERELNSIISNGFAVMYIIAQKLVWKSNADGYLVGSRGSVGSSFVATMSGITEVNPLRPHYRCEKCKYSDFDSEEVLAYSGRSGCDMPDKICPVCGEKLKKDGFDIPFETFLGFKGNKEPDIDLNFSGEYQSKAHRYTEVIFGAGQTFRAGTIGTLADKTAYGYVKNYFEERGVHKRPCEIERILQGCVGVRRTTGQHPGGIIVLPMGEEIYSFTPIQHPANDMTTDIVTTHFDYHSIDHNLLKLDILGHDDPTMIRMLEDLTGIDAKKIPLDDPSVMSLFANTEALGITPEDIGGCPLGSLGIPEFGTEFAIQMLVDTKPTSFSDLVRIAGLAHGTDVWLGNAQTLIMEGKATISTAICTRDDIMIYLISKGLESELSFTIMESVRKGKGLKPEWEKEMTDHGVPDWYIWSCKKIKYMFPKAHAAAYVMMAYRIAYCKVFYPLAYYAAFFSIRASAFDYELMCLGKERLHRHMRDYENRMDDLSKKEQDTYKDMKVVREMYARGFEFLPIDIYHSQATRFQIVDGKLLPSLSTIQGLGEKAAEAIVDAVQDGPFLSRDDFRERTKVSKTIVDLMGDLGILAGLPESNQMSLFDMLA